MQSLAWSCSPTQATASEWLLDRATSSRIEISHSAVSRVDVLTMPKSSTGDGVLSWPSVEKWKRSGDRCQTYQASKIRH